MIGIPMNVVAYCASEVQRQGDDAQHVFYMAQAWEYATLPHPGKFTEHDILVLGDMVKGGNLPYGYRRTAVSFRNGSLGADWWSIPHLMNRLLSFKDDATPDEFAKQFLDIHPFEDGNGRVASLIWNILNGTILTPLPLPYYYQEE